MKNGYLINTARGDVLNEQDLIEALDKGHLRGAAVDVIQNERGLENNPSPLINYAKNHPNLIITPHIGGASFDSMASTEIFMVNKLKNHLDHKER
jgi:phosphoglycerate dehydrogenase-like enzyme